MKQIDRKHVFIFQAAQIVSVYQRMENALPRYRGLQETGGSELTRIDAMVHRVYSDNLGVPLAVWNEKH